MSIKAVNVVLSADDSYIVAQTQGSLERPDDIIDLAKKETNEWGETAQGLKEWNVSNTAIFQDDTQTNPLGANGNVSLDIGSTPDTMQGLTSLEATFTNELSERGAFDDPLWRAVRVAAKSLEISVTGDYKDPNGTEGAAYDTLLTAQENGNTVSFALNFGVLTFSGDLRPADWTIDTQERGDDVQIDMTLQHDGAVTRDSGVLDTGQEAILAKWFDETLLTATMEHIEGDPTTSDPVDASTYYEGDALVETVTLSAERAEDLALEFDLAGDGALTRDVFTAA